MPRNRLTLPSVGRIPFLAPEGSACPDPSARPEKVVPDSGESRYPVSSIGRPDNPFNVDVRTQNRATVPALLILHRRYQVRDLLESPGERVTDWSSPVRSTCLGPGVGETRISGFSRVGGEGTWREFKKFRRNTGEEVRRSRVQWIR